MKVSVIVTLRRPFHATDRDVIRYVRQAVSEYGGCLEPPGYDPDNNVSTEGDPMFGIHKPTVKLAEG